MAINAGSVYSELILDTRKYQTGLNKADKDMKGFTGRLSQAGKKMTSTGKTLTTRLSLPIASLGALAVKTGMDFDSSMSQVKAISGATGEEFKRLRQKARDMGKSTKYSANEAAQAMKYMSMAGWSASETIGGLDGVMYLAAASGEDLATTSDIVTDSMTAFGLEADQAGHFADVLAKASSDSNTNVGIMGETFKYVAPLAGAMGYTIEDTGLAIGLMANNGVKGSRAGTALRGVLTRLVDPTDDSAAAMKRLGIKITDSNDEIKPFNVLISEMREKFKKLTPEQKAATAAQLGGQTAMSGLLAIVNASDKDFEKLQTSINNSTGAAKDMSDIMQDNLKGSVEELLSKLSELALQVSDILVPKLIAGAEKLGEWADKFSNLDEETQTTILKMAGLAAAIGPVLIAGGSLVSIISGGAKVFGLLKGAMAVSSITAGTTTGAFGALGVGVGALSAPVLAGAAAVAALGYAGYKTYKHFQEEAIPAVDLYGNKVSEATQKAVDGYMKLNDEATLELNQLAWSQETITDEMIASQNEKYTAMTEMVLAKLDEKHNSEREKTVAFFEESYALSQEQEAQILQSMDNNHIKEQNKVTEAKEKIMEIERIAGEEKRKLTTDELTTINGLRDQMKTHAVKALSETEVESKAILEKMKTQSGNITARQAAEVVKNSKSQRDKAVKNAESQYNDTVKQIIRMRDETGIISGEQADKLIKDAGVTRDLAVKEAEGMHKNVVSEAKAQAKEHVNEVDWTKGEVKSKWEIIKSDASDKAKKMKDNVVRDVKDIASKFKDKGEDIKSRWSTAMENVKDNADDNIGKARDFIDKGVGKIKKAFDFKLKIPDISPPKLPKLPKFSISGKFSLNPPSIPKLGVKWNAEGAIFTKPYIFGNQGVGEAGPEAILPIEKLSNILADTLKVILPKQSMGNNNIIVKNNQSIDYGKLSDVMIEAIETNNSNKPIIIKLISDGREIAEASSPHVSNNMVLETKRRDW